MWGIKYSNIAFFSEIIYNIKNCRRKRKKKNESIRLFELYE